MTASSFAAFRRTVTVTWPRGQDAAAKAHLIATARAGHAEILAKARADGEEPSFEAFANRPGRPVEAVVLPGPIVYRYHHTRTILADALRLLREESPVVSGAYRSAHTLYVDGAPVPPGRAGAELAAGARLVISNPVPYARKIEIGRTQSGRAFVIQVEPRIYERVARRLAERYGAVARVRYTFVDVTSTPAGGGRAGAAARRAGRAPAIVIEPIAGTV